MKKICVIGTVGVPASYGGFETLVDKLIESNGVKFTVYCSSRHYTEKLNSYKNCQLVYVPFLKANGAMSVFYDIVSIIHALVVGHRNFLVLGVSGALIFPLLKLVPRVRLVTNIDGLEWRRSKWNKPAKFLLRFFEKIAVKFSDSIIADNDAISDYVHAEYRCSCETIAYGGDHAVDVSTLSQASMHVDQPIGKPYAFGLCRIEPENNVHIILEAFSKHGEQLIFVGNWNNSEYGKDLYKRFSNMKNMLLLDPIYCIDSLYNYRNNCLFYVHGHSAGGTNPSLVEMMHFGKLIVAYDCIFNRNTMENHGIYFDTVESLYQRLSLSIDGSDGEALLQVAKRRYMWRTVREQYINLF